MKYYNDSKQALLSKQVSVENNEVKQAWAFIKDQMPNFTFSHLIEEMRESEKIVEQALTTKSKKELAWEITVKKNVEIAELKICSNVEQYNSHNVFNNYLPLTEEEYDLLKRYLCQRE